MKKIIFLLLIVITLAGCSLPSESEGLVSVFIRKDIDGIFSSGIFILTLKPESGTGGDTREKAAYLSGYNYETITAFSGVESGDWTLKVDVYPSSDPGTLLLSRTSPIITVGNGLIEINAVMIYDNGTDTFDLSIS